MASGVAYKGGGTVEGWAQAVGTDERRTKTVCGWG